MWPVHYLGFEIETNYISQYQSTDSLQTPFCEKSNFDGRFQPLCPKGFPVLPLYNVYSDSYLHMLHTSYSETSGYKDNLTKKKIVYTKHNCFWTTSLKTVFTLVPPCFFFFFFKTFLCIYVLVVFGGGGIFRGFANLPKRLLKIAEQFVSSFSILKLTLSVIFMCMKEFFSSWNHAKLKSCWVLLLLLVFWLKSVTHLDLCFTEIRKTQCAIHLDLSFTEICATHPIGSPSSPYLEE